MGETNLFASPSSCRRTPGLSLGEKIDLCRGIFAFLVVSARHAIELAWALDPSRERGTAPPCARLPPVCGGDGALLRHGLLRDQRVLHPDVGKASGGGRDVPPEDLHDGPADADPPALLRGPAGHRGHRVGGRPVSGADLVQRVEPAGPPRPVPGDPELRPRPTARSSPPGASPTRWSTTCSSASSPPSVAQPPPARRGRDGALHRRRHGDPARVPGRLPLARAPEHGAAFRPGLQLVPRGPRGGACGTSWCGSRRSASPRDAGSRPWR